jgi:hypothetical protein
VDLIDGWSFEPTPTPVLRSIDDPSVVALAADWPELQPVELPDPAASVVHAQDGIVTARTSTDLYVSDGEEKWSAVPLDVEHGITGGVIVLPGDPPRVAMFDRGRMQILTWR